MLDFFKDMMFKGAAAFVLALAFISCSDLHGDDFIPSTGNGNPHPDRIEVNETRNVLLLYSAGFNSLSSYLAGDFNDLKKGYVPGERRNDDVLLVYMHVPESRGKYTKASSPVLMRLHSDPEGKVVTDTLVVYDKGTVSASATQLNNVLEYVSETFPAKGYGMIFSSHATGWLPSGYYANSEEYENGTVSARLFSSSVSGMPVPVPFVAPEYDPSTPLTKSIGQDRGDYIEDSISYEMELADFAEAIPMHMDYILFDACLMGGIEVAYQLKDVCDLVGFSQAEVLAEGLDYTTVTKHLFLESEPMPEKVCEDYFNYYNALSGLERSATISLVDCRRLDTLAGLCSRLFSDYSVQLAELNPRKVQRFFRSGYHWFYDLESILTEAGISDAEISALHSALDECVVYKAATPSFMGTFDIETFSGFSMFLPADGGERLKEFYKTLEWNKATGLVK